MGDGWSGRQSGFGEVQPESLYDGLGPTGLLRRVRWDDWGNGRAYGWAVGLFQWPGTSLGEARPMKARVVAFRLGVCGGRAAYTAVEWYFPGYSGRFDPRRYLDACSGDHVDRIPDRLCADISVSGLRVNSISAQMVGCRFVRRLIRAAALRHYSLVGGRFKSRGYYCGTIGAGPTEPRAKFECAKGSSQIAFTASL